MNKEVIIESLSPIERIVLPSLSSSYQNIDKISEKNSLDKTSVLRALSFLKNKSLVEIKEDEKEIVDLDFLGII